MNDTVMYPTSQMELLSVSYVKTIASYCGFGANIPEVDNDSIDLVINSSVGKRAKLDIQLKSSTNIDTTKDFSYPLPLKNYNDLRLETICPRILVVLSMPKNSEEWIKHTVEELALRKCAYWLSLLGYPENNNTSSVAVTMPVKNIFSPEALKDLMDKAGRGETL